MTWLSRTRTKARSSSQRNTTRRRLASLEALEHRLVLSGNVTTNVQQLMPSGAYVLNIMGDVGNDHITITENTNGTVTVTGVPFGPNATTVDGSPSTTTPVGETISAINVSLPGVNNYDSVTINGAGKTTSTGVDSISIAPYATSATDLSQGPNLTLSIQNSDNPGNVTVTTHASSTSPYLGGGLTANIDNSTFGSLNIDQTGCCPAHVELGNDTVAGNVRVSEGAANGDTIVLDAPPVGTGAGPGDVFGPTLLIQGNDPLGHGGGSTCVGANDSISVSTASVVNLTANQNVSPTTKSGANNKINVNGLQVALTSFGVRTSQGNGANDVTSINNVTSPIPGSGSPNTLNIYNLPSIVVVQGNGNSDAASVTNSTLPGNVSITQGTSTSGGSNDTALVSGGTYGFTTSIPGYPAVGGNISITQGTGNKNEAAVANLTAFGNINITQHDVCGNTTGDLAQVINVTDNLTIAASPFVIDVNGTVTIVQGDAYADTAVMYGDAVNNIVAKQGENCTTPECTPGFSDVVEINKTTVTSDISVTQGNWGDTANNGNYVTAIGYDYIGNFEPTLYAVYPAPTPLSTSSSTPPGPGTGLATTPSGTVTAGGSTSIYQHYGNNQVYLGDGAGFGSSGTSNFNTGYLDIWTGSFGDSYVAATNTHVSYGSNGYYDVYGVGPVFGSGYMIDGGTVGSFNSYFDAGGNTILGIGTILPANPGTYNTNP